MSRGYGRFLRVTTRGFLWCGLYNIRFDDLFDIGSRAGMHRGVGGVQRVDLVRLRKLDVAAHRRQFPDVRVWKRWCNNIVNTDDIVEHRWLEELLRIERQVCVNGAKSDTALRNCVE